MKYQRLEAVLASALPINRKERFYTGTVLPALLFHNGLSNLRVFLGAIPEFPKEAAEAVTADSFLFYTEYNLKESAGSRSVGAEISTETRDTPDVIIHILEPLTIFVIVEAKMFQKLTQNVLNAQMRAQREAVMCKLQEKYEADRTFHVALLPRKLGFTDTADYTVLNWEFFIDNQQLDVQGNYFYPYLKFALARYEHLVSVAPVIEKVPGSVIYNDGNPEKRLWVGRRGGRTAIEGDVTTDGWRGKLYAINAGGPPTGGRAGNWLTSEEFARMVEDGQRRKGDTPR